MMETDINLSVENEVDITCVDDDSLKMEEDLISDNEDTGKENEGNYENVKQGEHFVVSTNEEMREIIEEYCERTNSHFVVQKKSKNFGLAASDCDLLGHQVQWMDMQKKNGAAADSIVQFDGVPHICVGNFYLNCQFGVDSSISKKMKRRRMREEGELDNIKPRHLKTPSKKCGCPATIVVRQIIKFPEFKIEKDTEWRRRDGAGKLKAKIKECRESLVTEVIIIGRLPDVSEHKYHEILAGHPYTKEVIHRDIILKAQEMFLENKTHNEIREALHQYAVNEKFMKGEEIDFNRRRFFPTIKDIHNIVGRFRPLCRFTPEEENRVKSLIDTLKECGNKFNIVFNIDENNINYDNNGKVESSSDESVENVNEKEGKERKKRDKTIQTFSFTYQTPKQQRLMRKYCNVSYIVEVELSAPIRRTLTYRLYTLIVQTNVDFQVIGCIVVSKQRKDGLVEGLKLFREWNPSWNPKYFLVDCSQAIYDAVSVVFPDSNYLLNPHSCEGKWIDFISSPSNGLQHNSEQLLAFLKNMQYALTEDALNVAAAFLEASEIWQSSEKLRSWFLTSWLPVAKMWVFGYRPEDLLITQHMKSSLADCIRLYREALTSSAKPNGLVEMLEHLTQVVSYNEYQKYVASNNNQYVFFQSFLKNKNYSEFMQGIPTFLIPYTEGICKLAQTNDFSITCDNLGVFSVQANIDECLFDKNETVIFAETEYGCIEYPAGLDSGEYTVSFGDSNSHPFCTCSQWLFYRIPCVHMFSIICKIPGWKYDMLSPLYRFSPVFDIDCSCIHHPLHSNFREEYSQVDITYKCVETQTDNVQDEVFEFPFHNGSLSILSEELKKTNKALFHLKNISHMFKSQSFYANIHFQLKNLINEIDKEITHAREDLSMINDWLPINTTATDKEAKLKNVITGCRKTGQITKAPIINLGKGNNLEFLHQAIKKIESNNGPNTSVKPQIVPIMLDAKNTVLQSGVCESPYVTKIISSPTICLKRKLSSDKGSILEDKFTKSCLMNQTTPLSRENTCWRESPLEESGTTRGEELKNSELSVLSILPKMTNGSAVDKTSISENLSTTEKKVVLSTLENTCVLLGGKSGEGVTKVDKQLQFGSPTSEKGKILNAEIEGMMNLSQTVNLDNLPVIKLVSNSVGDTPAIASHIYSTSLLKGGAICKIADVLEPQERIFVENDMTTNKSPTIELIPEQIETDPPSSKQIEIDIPCDEDDGETLNTNFVEIQTLSQYTNLNNLLLVKSEANTQRNDTSTSLNGTLCNPAVLTNHIRTSEDTYNGSDNHKLIPAETAEPVVVKSTASVLTQVDLVNSSNEEFGLGTKDTETFSHGSNHNNESGSQFAFIQHYFESAKPATCSVEIQVDIPSSEEHRTSNEEIRGDYFHHRGTDLLDFNMSEPVDKNYIGNHVVETKIHNKENND